MAESGGVSVLYVGMHDFFELRRERAEGQAALCRLFRAYGNCGSRKTENEEERKWVLTSAPPQAGCDLGPHPSPLWTFISSSSKLKRYFIS